MRITQGTFSFLPDFTDREIAAQVGYALRRGWSISIEHTDDPHPRNAYWQMWGAPMFDLDESRVGAVIGELRSCREAFPDRYVKLVAYDSSHTRQTTALSFIVQRPKNERGFRIERTDDHDRTTRYRLRHRTAEDDA